jgi:NADH:ubiquinone oxidoreductase subunit F (NADH-binding)
MAKSGIQLGHGGLVAVQTGTDYRELLRQWLKFMVDESCGKCVPCRLGSKQAWQAMQAEQISREGEQDISRLLTVIEQASLCAFGQYIPVPMRKLLKAFSDDIFNRGDRT